MFRVLAWRKVRGWNNYVNKAVTIHVGVKGIQKSLSFIVFSRIYRTNVRHRGVDVVV